MQREYWPLIALKTAPPVDPSGELRRLTSMQLQKALFVLGQRYGKTLGKFYEFVPYHYGPFSRAIEDDLKRLQEQHLVSFAPSTQDWEITSEGLHLAEDLAAQQNAECIAYLVRLTEWMRRVSRATLLHAIYERFPEYARKGSAILDE